MSTRANIVITDNYGDELWFYRHWDGYPEVTAESLNRFLAWVKDGKIRQNANQSAGWLVILGAIEDGIKVVGDSIDLYSPSDWKCGAYEPTTGIHGDIEWLYVVDVSECTLKAYTEWDEDGATLDEIVEGVAPTPLA